MNQVPMKSVLWTVVLCFGGMASAQTADLAATQNGEAGVPARQAVDDARPSINPVPKQTARQALLEMFFGHKPGAFEKHLPSAMHEFLKTANGGVSLNDVLQVS